MDFMTCNSCTHLVEVNPTGICLGCQMGFAGPQKDSWRNFPEEKKEIKGVLDHAIEKGIEQEGSSAEHQDGNRSGKGPETIGSDRAKRRRKTKKEA